jgi:hypothetical protein
MELARITSLRLEREKQNGDRGAILAARSAAALA